MVQQMVLEKERKRRKSAVEFLQWLESVGGIFLAVSELLRVIGWTIVRIAQFIRSIMGLEDWREQYT